jgi:hypothetical protein
MIVTNQDRQSFVTLSPFAAPSCLRASAHQGKLREGSSAMGTEMLRRAQHDKTDLGRETS